MPLKKAADFSYILLKLLPGLVGRGRLLFVLDVSAASAEAILNSCPKNCSFIFLSHF